MAGRMKVQKYAKHDENYERKISETFEEMDQAIYSL